MATKSTTKPPARKAATTARRPAKTVPQKEALPKAKESKAKAAEKPAHTTTPAKEKGAPARVTGAAPETTEETPKSVSKMESVSLIDKPKAKSADGVPKVRTTFLHRPAATAGCRTTASACRSGCRRCCGFINRWTGRGSCSASRGRTEKRHHNQAADHCEGTGNAARAEKFPADQRADG